MSEPFTSEQKRIDAPADGLPADGLNNIGGFVQTFVGRFIQTCAASILIAAPAHAMTSKDKTGITVSIGCGSGLVGGVIADSQNSNGRKNSMATIGTSTAIGCLAGLAWSFFFQEDREQILTMELDKYKAMDRNEGRMLIDEKLLTKGPDRTTCTGQEVRYGLLWPGTDGRPTSAGEPQVAYLSSKIAIQYVAFYSFDGCFPGPYVKAPDLKLYMESIFKSEESKK